MGAILDNVVAAAKENFWLAGDEPRSSDHGQIDDYGFYDAAHETVMNMDRADKLNLIGELMDESRPFGSTNDGSASSFSDINTLVVTVVADEVYADPEIREADARRDKLAQAARRPTST